LAPDYHQAGHEAQHAEMTSILYVLEQYALKNIVDAILLPVPHSLLRLKLGGVQDRHHISSKAHHKKEKLYPGLRHAKQ